MMLSAADHLREIARCHALGIATHVTKPVRRAQLLAAVRAALGGTSHPHAAPATLEPGRPRALRVLLAEDNVVNQKLAVSLLEQAGHQVRVVANGQLAVDALREERFDLVLMDVQMPVMSGLEATRLVREREAAGDPRVPIVALTARAMAGDRQACLDAGMDAYLSKPVRRDELLTTIAGLTAATAPAAAGAIAPARGDEQVADAAVDDEAVDDEAMDDEGDKPDLDLDVLQAAVGGRRTLLRELLAVFAEDCPQQVEAVCGAIRRGDMARLETAAHVLKGAAATIAATRVETVARELETAGRAGNPRDAAAALDRLEPAVARLRARLEALEGDLEGTPLHVMPT
jgi:CheY-like chemotaxis protein/HPt (histidine-containing phosphotransfer) domain-containing protein